MAGHHSNKDDSCVLGGDRTGVIFILAPGSPPCVLVSSCVLPVTTDPSCWHNVLPSRIHRGATHQTSNTRHQRLSSTMECIVSARGRTQFSGPLWSMTIVPRQPGKEGVSRN